MPLPSASHDPLMPDGFSQIGETLRRRLDGPWTRHEDGTDTEDSRGD